MPFNKETKQTLNMNFQLRKQEKVYVPSYWIYGYWVFYLQNNLRQKKDITWYYIIVGKQMIIILWRNKSVILKNWLQRNVENIGCYDYNQILTNESNFGIK